VATITIDRAALKRIEIRGEKATRLAPVTVLAVRQPGLDRDRHLGGRASRHLEARRIEDVPLDRARSTARTIAARYFSGKPAGRRRSRRMASSRWRMGLLSVPSRRPRPPVLIPPLLSEAEGIEPGAGGERGEEEVEGLGGRVGAAMRGDLVGRHGEALEMCRDGAAARPGGTAGFADALGSCVD
jgi:hypothetical protein